jgi:hypothetical protein
MSQAGCAWVSGVPPCHATSGQRGIKKHALQDFCDPSHEDNKSNDVEEDGSRRQEVVYVSPIFDSSTKQ